MNEQTKLQENSIMLTFFDAYNECIMSTKKHQIKQNLRHGKTLPALLSGLFFLMTVQFTSAQSNEKEAIKSAIRSATEAFYERDADRWKSYRLQDSKASTTYIRNGQHYAAAGWENFGPDMISYLNENDPVPGEFENKDFIIYQNDDLAYVEYDQHKTMPKASPYNKRISREYRVMVKQNGQWKIATSVTVDSETFESTDRNIEANLNRTGYQLLAKDKVKEAIEVFKLNVMFYPDSWNVYDSLGEAYAEAGEIEKAIENYKKSIELNPDNENGKKALEKLQKKVSSSN